MLFIFWSRTPGRVHHAAYSHSPSARWPCPPKSRHLVPPRKSLSCLPSFGTSPRFCSSRNLVQSSGTGAGLGPLVNFYSKLPKGPAPTSAGGIKARFFNGKNASAAPILFGILTIFTLSYTLDYQSTSASFFFILRANIADVWVGTAVFCSLWERSALE